MPLKMALMNRGQITKSCWCQNISKYQPFYELHLIRNGKWMRWLRPGFRGFSGVSSMLKLETFLLLQFFSSYPKRLMKRQERINPFLYAKTFINRNVSYQIHPMYSMGNDDSWYEWWEVVPRILPCCSFMNSHTQHCPLFPLYGITPP